jgi:hypothetical protein
MNVKELANAFGQYMKNKISYTELVILLKVLGPLR